MCSLFGIYDYKGVLKGNELRKLTNVLAREAEVRGKDAAGIAYNSKDKLRIFKRGLPAHKLCFAPPTGVKVVMGHTRLTTQGNERYYQNNHPFQGQNFALAHNGIITNELTLKQQYHLPHTNIETDSYVAVQLLEQADKLDFRSIHDMAEKIHGTFAFSILDRKDNLYLVKGNNPIEIYEGDGFCRCFRWSGTVSRSFGTCNFGYLKCEKSVLFRWTEGFR